MMTSMRSCLILLILLPRPYGQRRVCLYIILCVCFRILLSSDALFIFSSMECRNPSELVFHDESIGKEPVFSTEESRVGLFCATCLLHDAMEFICCCFFSGCGCCWAFSATEVVFSFNFALVIYES